MRRKRYVRFGAIPRNFSECFAPFEAKISKQSIFKIKMVVLAKPVLDTQQYGKCPPSWSAWSCIPKRIAILDFPVGLDPLALTIFFKKAFW